MRTNIDISKMNLPGDLKNLSSKQKEAVCRQLRNKIIDTVSQNGGHLASNLGVVELSVALHSVFESPKDKIVWDVGHQCYPHKLLTGRFDSFSSLRKENGISGFTKPNESKHDAAISGHSSNSISLALGMATAMSLNNNPHHAIAVIGDGALTGGLAYEGLNNAGKSEKNIIVILNHNEMSISKNTGAMAKYLAELRTTESYLKTKSTVQKILLQTPVVGKPIRDALSVSKNGIKYAVLQSTFFEKMGFEFFGPVAGHNISELERVLAIAKSMNRPVFIHVNTVKGKGFTPAEQQPGEFHCVSKFDKRRGFTPRAADESVSAFFGKMLTEFADSDTKICAVTAAMKYGTGLDAFAKKYRDRFFDVGIAEEHAVTFCAGLAKSGMLPVFAVYSTFLQRSYDEIIHDLAIDNLHAVLAVDRAGIVGEDGETHQGLFDVAFLSTIPNVTVYSPSNTNELSRSLERALFCDSGIVCVRYPKAFVEDFKYGTACDDYAFEENGGETLLITYGRIYKNVKTAQLRLDELGCKCDVLKLVRILPLCDDVINKALSYRYIYFFEEGMKSGSVSEKFALMLFEKGFSGKIFINAIDDFVPQSTVDSAIDRLGLSSDKIFERVREDFGLDKT